MRAFLLVLCLAACTTTGAQPRLPDAGAFGAAVRSGAIDAETFDFAAAGFWDLDQSARAAWRTGVQEILRPADTPLSCSPEDRRGLAALAWTQLAAAAPSADDWRQDATALRAEMHRVDALIDAQADGEADAGMDDSLRLSQREMSEAFEPRTRELLRRVIRDQSVRFIWRAGAGEALPERAASQWGMAVGGRFMSSIDCDNTHWLREQLAEITWFDIPTYGQRADRAAWLITQHADRTPEFQRGVLSRLERLPTGQTDPGNLAYLSDRIATADGRPQRYGTQMTCEGGIRQPTGGLEDAANVDARRAAAGLMPLAEYRAAMDRRRPCASESH